MTLDLWCEDLLSFPEHSRVELLSTVLYVSCPNQAESYHSWPTQVRELLFRVTSFPSPPITHLQLHSVVITWHRNKLMPFVGHLCNLYSLLRCAPLSPSTLLLFLFPLLLVTLLCRENSFTSKLQIFLFLQLIFSPCYNCSTLSSSFN